MEQRSVDGRDGEFEKKVEGREDLPAFFFFFFSTEAPPLIRLIFLSS